MARLHERVDFGEFGAAGGVHVIIDDHETNVYFGLCGGIHGITAQASGRITADEAEAWIALFQKAVERCKENAARIAAEMAAADAHNAEVR